MTFSYLKYRHNKFLLFVIGLCIIFQQYGFTQNQFGEEKLDSLQQVLQKTSEPKDKVALLLAISSYATLLDKELSLNSALEARRLAEYIPNDTLLADVYRTIQTAYYFQDNIDLSLLYLDSAIWIAQKLELLSLQGDFELGKAELYNFTGQHNEAYQQITSAIKHFQEDKNEYWENFSKVFLAITLDHVNEYKQARPLYEETLDYLTTQTDQDFYYKSYQYAINYYAIHLSDSGYKEKATEMFHQIRKKGREDEDNYAVMIGSINLGWRFALDSQLDSAAYYCQEGLDLYDDIHGQAYTCKCLGYIALQNNELQQAEEYLLKAANITKAIPIPEEYAETSDFLAQLYEKKHEFFQALSYAEETKRINDSLFNLNKSRQLALLQTQFGIEEEERKNEILENRIEYQSKKSSYLLVGSILAILVAILSFVMAYQRKKNKNKLEQTVAKRTKALQFANQELKEFAYITSHDMREPIRSIHSFSKLAEKRLVSNQITDVKEYLDIIGKSSIQLNNLVSDVYHFIKIEESAIKKETFELHNILTDIATDLSLQIKEKNAELDFGDNIPINNNYSLLKLILKNLIENGIKYNESVPAKVQVSCSETSEFYEFIVADNGIGIEKEFRDYVFRMFKRLHNRGKYPGSGLGLPICKKIVQQLGGEIYIEDIGVDQRGTSFIFTILK